MACSASVSVFPPRMYEMMHVQMREVEATHGMRMCIGMIEKLIMVDGTHSFQSATRSCHVAAGGRAHIVGNKWDKLCRGTSGQVKSNRAELSHVTLLESRLAEVGPAVTSR